MSSISRSVISVIVSELDHDWEEAKDWVNDLMEREDVVDQFTTLFAVTADEFRATASEDEITCFQRLARLAFWEAFSRIYGERREQAEGREG